LIAITLEARRETGLLDPAIDVAVQARRLLILIQGIAIQAIVDTAGWSPERQLEFLASELALAGLAVD